MLETFKSSKGFKKISMFVRLPNEHCDAHDLLIMKGFSFAFCYLMRSVKANGFTALHINDEHQFDENYTNYKDEWDFCDPSKFVVGETPPTLVDDKFDPPTNPPPCDGRSVWPLSQLAVLVLRKAATQTWKKKNC